MYVAQVATADASIICANLPGNMTDEQLMNVCGWLKDTYSDRMIVALEKLDMHGDFATRLSKTAEKIAKRYDKEPEK